MTIAPLYQMRTAALEASAQVAPTILSSVPRSESNASPRKT
jgi:hypothetical protein